MTDVVQVLSLYVSLLEREAAKGAAWRAARALGIPQPAIKWYALPWETRGPTVPIAGPPAAAAKSLGFVRAREPSVIWLRTGQDVAELVNTVAHECAHVADLRSSGLKAFWSSKNHDAVKTFAATFTRALRNGTIRPY